MNHPIYGVFGSWLILFALAGAAAAACVAVYSLVKLVIAWKTPDRRRYAVRLAVAAAAVPCLWALPVLYFHVWIAPRMQEMADNSPAGRELAEAGRAAEAAIIDETSIVRVGDPAPAFALATVDGDRFDTIEVFDAAGGAGDVVVLNFFATWCGPCLKELPHLQRLWEERGGDAGFRLLVVGRGETAGAVRAFRAEHGLTLPMAADPDRAVYDLFAEELIPRTYVIARDGTVVLATAGFRESEFAQLEAVVEAKLAAVAD